MQKARLGSSELLVSPVIMGMSQAGKEHWVGIDEDEILNAIRSAIDSGILAFDTAEKYGEGLSEQLLAKAVGKRRSEVLYFSKVFPNHLRYDQVIQSCHYSLKNLKTESIDLYQIHWPSGAWNSEVVPISETMRALCDLKKSGKIRAIGVSNFSLKQLEEAREFGPIDSIQPPYSLFWRGIEKEIYPYCQNHQVSVLAYAPLFQGLLTGKIQDRSYFPMGDHRFHNRAFSEESFPLVLKCIDQLRGIALEKGCTLAQLALAWVFSHSQVFCVAGARNAKQSVENAKAMTINLNQEEQELLSKICWPVAEQFMDQTIIWNFPI